MSSQTKICFDASYQDGTVGIGIFNFDTKEEVYCRYTLLKDVNDSTLMETMALVQTIKYMRQNNITKAHLFTDNKSVADKGVSKTISEGLKVTLNWIPREFNTDADRLSKLAHTLVATELGSKPLKPMNTTYKKSPVIVEVNTDISRKMTDKLKEYSLEKRLNLIKMMYPDRNVCMNAIFSDKIHFGLCKKDMKVFRMLKAILSKEEFNSLANREVINTALGRFKLGKYNNQDVVNHIKMYA